MAENYAEDSLVQMQGDKLSALHPQTPKVAGAGDWHLRWLCELEAMAA